LPIYHPKTAGKDIEDFFHETAICDENGVFEGRKYDAFSKNLKKLIDWLLSEDISTWAIESKSRKEGGFVATVQIYTMINEKTPYDKELIAKNNDRIKEEKIRFYEKKI
jgi:hypothetical protein